MSILVAVPTYNEINNVRAIARRIFTIAPDSHLLFVDDNSPDGTGDLIDQMAIADSRIRIIHRFSKLGIGSAHQAAIKHGYEHGYPVLITLDADLTHAPESIPALVKLLSTVDVAVASRFIRKEGISEWNKRRKFLTLIGHILTRILLNIPYDATGAFRAYKLSKINPLIFDLVKSTGYSFFFESLKILELNGVPIKESPVKLSSRAGDKSKMKLRDIHQSLMFMLVLSFNSSFKKEHLKLD